MAIPAKPDQRLRTESCVVSQSGDCVVLHSDGISEAANAGEELLGFDRAIAAVGLACSAGLAPDGTLTLTLGDATGHGMTAGTVVTATKSLFRSYADQPTITGTFTALSRSLKGMNLPRLGMAMVIIRVQDHRLTVPSAGVPPVLIHQAACRDIDETETPGVPLGGSRRRSGLSPRTSFSTA
jgi:serine phosphatase RsbU (regulator of sigma subunit)